MGKKQQVIQKLYNQCLELKNFEFDNTDVARVCSSIGFSNQFDATKVDSSKVLPTELINSDIFIAHLGNGRHRFVQGIDVAYHTFEPITSNNTKPWPYRESILNNINSSESNSLFVAYNQRILQDFLYEDIQVTPKVYGSHRTKCDIFYSVLGEHISTNKLQIEIDLTLEYNGNICIFEAKNGDPKDFNVYQIFNPFKYYIEKHLIDASSIKCCYLLRKDNSIKLYLYTFKNDFELSSISLVRNAEYRLEKR